MSTEDRPPIPDPVKREVRQRCGFGCVICGRSLFEYHHIVDWSVVKEHEAENLTLLCKHHHAEATSKLLPQNDVIEANKNPICKAVGSTYPHALHYSGDQININIGSNLLVAKSLEGTSSAALIIDGQIIIGFAQEHGHPLVRCDIFDSRNNRMLSIWDNELVYQHENWDVEWTAQNLVVREEHGKILIHIKFEPPDKISIVRGRIIFNGVELLIRPEYIFLMNDPRILYGNVVVNKPIGIFVGQPMVRRTVDMDYVLKHAAFILPDVPRYDVNRKSSMASLRRMLRSKLKRFDP